MCALFMLLWISKFNAHAHGCKVNSCYYAWEGPGDDRTSTDIQQTRLMASLSALIPNGRLNGYVGDGETHLSVTVLGSGNW